MIARNASLDARAMTAMVLLCLLWGVQQVVIKSISPEIPPLSQAAVRSLAAAVLVWLWCAWRGVRLFDRDKSFWPGVAAGLLFGSEFLLIFQGLMYTTASRAVILLYTAPFVVAIGVHLFVPGEKIDRRQGLGLLLAFLGVALAFSDSLTLPSREALIGDAMLLGAAVLWGATTVLIKASRLVTLAPAKTLFYQLVVSGPLMLAAALLAGENIPAALSIGGWAGMFYQGAIVAFASYLAWFWLISRYSAARLSSFSFLTPLFGMAAGAFFLHEQVGLALMLALALVAAGIQLVNRPKPAQS